MKIGPKGQVVIPKVFRESKKIYPGDTISLELKEDSIIIKKPKENPIKIFEVISKKINSDKIDSDKDYKEMMEKRWKKVT